MSINSESFAPLNKPENFQLISQKNYVKRERLSKILTAVIVILGILSITGIIAGTIVSGILPLIAISGAVVLLTALAIYAVHKKINPATTYQHVGWLDIDPQGLEHLSDPDR
ncbi:Rab5-interacting family protein [Candidatus Chlamydia sanziniae]|uniref:Uncharacterized protein n=1 Tax=Candidatus Chlamydia sanziniae TaxID=1806891 RepID=A0A1A9HVT7_9CHLA|nr:Rab5-interacting family protein [Candidatus Chlamydia sanziniae]ANH79130.1 hypothetical protein Cs308_0960 [Candidatus Chlamydia sanziniae]